MNWSKKCVKNPSDQMLMEKSIEYLFDQINVIPFQIPFPFLSDLNEKIDEEENDF